MRTINPDLVLVRGINSDWLNKNFSKLWIGFGTSDGNVPQTVPKEDANYVGLYLGAPISAITHIGIVDHIDDNGGELDYYLKAIIKLKTPIDPGHPIRKHENKTLADFGLTRAQMENIRMQLATI